MSPSASCLLSVPQKSLQRADSSVFCRRPVPAPAAAPSHQSLPARGRFEPGMARASPAPGPPPQPRPPRAARGTSEPGELAVPQRSQPVPVPVSVLAAGGAGGAEGAEGERLRGHAGGEGPAPTAEPARALRSGPLGSARHGSTRPGQSAPPASRPACPTCAGAGPATAEPGTEAGTGRSFP